MEAYRCPNCGSPHFTRIIIRRSKVRIERDRVIREGEFIPTWAGYACYQCKSIVPVKDIPAARKREEEALSRN